jgi:hypothetical protein
MVILSAIFILYIFVNLYLVTAQDLGSVTLECYADSNCGFHETTMFNVNANSCLNTGETPFGGSFESAAVILGTRSCATINLKAFAGTNCGGRSLGIIDSEGGCFANGSIS